MTLIIFSSVAKAEVYKPYRDYFEVDSYYDRTINDDLDSWPKVVNHIMISISGVKNSWKSELLSFVSSSIVNYTLLIKSMGMKDGSAN